MVLANGAPILTIYPVGLCLSLLMLVLTWVGWPRAGLVNWNDAPSGLSLRQALGEIAHLPVALRILAMGAVNSGGVVYWAVMSLSMAKAGNNGDAALYAGLVAGLEVPFMLALPLCLRWISRTGLIVVGALLYAFQLVGIPLLAGTPWVWLMILPGAAGAGVTLTLPIAYLQDLLADRPGTGASLMALQFTAGSALSAACFALGTWAAPDVSGYGLAGVFGTIVTVGGAVAAHLADRKRR